jgi:hypothetical protein
MFRLLNIVLNRPTNVRERDHTVTYRHGDGSISHGFMSVGASLFYIFG